MTINIELVSIFIVGCLVAGYLLLLVALPALVLAELVRQYRGAA